MRMNDYYVLVDNNLMQVISRFEKLPQNWRNISNLHNFDDEKLKDLAWAGHSDIGWVKLSSEFLKEYVSTKENLELNKNQFKSLVSEERWEKENSSTIINGVNIVPNEKTRYSLWIKRYQCLEDPTKKVNYKLLNKFYTFTSKQIIELCDGVENYVQSCYDIEMKCYEQIDSFNHISDFINLNHGI